MINTNFQNGNTTSYRLAPKADSNANAAAPSPSGDTVTIGNYNVKNWFAPEDANQELGKRAKPENELRALAQNIQKSKVDILSMEEVGTSKENVKKFFDTKLPGQFPYLAMTDTNDARGVHVIIASKYPITNVVSHTGATFPLGDGTGEAKFSRDLLRADVDVKGIPVTVYATHAKSRRTYAANDPAHPGGADPTNQRIGEEKAASKIMASEMKEFPGRLYTYNGDLNDGRRDASVQAVLNPSEGPKMFDSLDSMPEDQSRTWPADPRAGHGHQPEQFDHILAPADQRSKLVESHIVDFPGISQQASDHLEVVSTFNLR